MVLSVVSRGCCQCGDAGLGEFEGFGQSIDLAGVGVVLSRDRGCQVLLRPLHGGVFALFGALAQAGRGG
jgi:hypothetical protein